MKKIGLACSGGGTKSTCSIGVIKAFQELGIEISAISGSSIGSCIAILYAAGYTVDEMERKMKHYTIEYPKFSFLDKIAVPFNLLFRAGGKDPKNIYENAKQSMEEKRKVMMSDFSMPIFIPTLDITTKQTVYYSSRTIEGEICYSNREIAEAVKNTSSLPFLYIPNNVMIDGELHQFLDGGIMNNIPTKHLKKFSEVVVGVEITYHKRIEGKKVNILTGIRNTFQAMRRSAVVGQREAGDVIIEIDVGNVDIIAGEKEVEFCVQKGYETVMNMAKEGMLDSLLENKVL